ncbi:hypothetical protein JOB18_011658 [Solea senegalensis]|uniref:Uncharacterized protein n=1 Tax=Solea senegalensis TaxID=28829 RepID=A0AAV6QZR8_SOLSE|nr:hypothetical protein JOB18_011658 [Solea senegalensis]
MTTEQAVLTPTSSPPSAATGRQRQCSRCLCEDRPSRTVSLFGEWLVTGMDALSSCPSANHRQQEREEKMEET